MNIIWKLKNSFKYASLNGQNNVVKKVEWICECELSDTDDDGVLCNYNACVQGSTILDTSNLDSFIEWADLTNADIVNFVKAKLGSEKVAEIEDEAKLMSEFNKPNNSVSGLPE